MYTKFDDLNMMKTIRKYLAINPTATRKNIRKNCFTNERRLRMLETEGYQDIPKPMLRGQRNKKYYEDKALQSASA